MKKGQIAKSDLAFLSKASQCGTTRTEGLFRVSVSGTRCRCRRRFLVLRTCTHAQSTSQNGHNHDRFQKIQCISPPFPASCSALVGMEHHRSNAFLDVSPV